LSENVFRVLKKECMRFANSVLTTGTCLMVYRKSDLFDQFVYTIENLVQRMRFTVLANPKNCPQISAALVRIRFLRD